MLLKMPFIVDSTPEQSILKVFFQLKSYLFLASSFNMKIKMRKL